MVKKKKIGLTVKDETTRDLILGSAKPGPDVPDFMYDDIGVGTEEMGKYIRPPRIQVVLALSKNLTDEFNVGDVVIVPQKMLLAPVKFNEHGKPEKLKVDAGEPIFAVPILFFAEFICWNPREVDSLPAIHERTTDENSPLAAKCRDRRLWLEDSGHTKDDKTLMRRNTEHLNYVVVPVRGEFAGTPMALSYSRSEHRVGSSFAALIRTRRAPLFGCIFKFTAGYRENAQGEWYGLDARNPDANDDVPGMIQDEDVYEHLRSLHEEYAHATVEIDMETDESADPASAKAEF